MKNFHVLLTALTLAFAGCVGEKTHLQPPVEYKSLQNLQEGFKREDPLMVPYVLNFHGTPATDELHDAIFGTMTGAKLFVPSSEIAAKSIRKDDVFPLDWISEDNKVSKFLSDHANDALISFYKQQAAVDMLRKTNILRDRSKEAVNALGKYTEVLITEGTYSPGLVYYSFKNLKSEWKSDKIKDLRDRALLEHSKYNDDYLKTIKDFKESATNSAFHDEMAKCFEATVKQNLLYIEKLNAI